MSSDRLAVVTGAPGWAGSRLVHFLRAPHPDWPAGDAPPAYGRIRCLVHSETGQDRLGDVERVLGDLRDRGAVARLLEGAAGADLFHFAGLIHPGRVRELDEINGQGTRILIDQAVRAGVRRVIGLSSNSVAGAARNPATVFDEATPPSPYLGYGRSKAAMERAITDAPVDSVLLRPCWFYGPEQPERQTLFFRMIKDGKAPLVAKGRPRRSVSYVDAIALAALLAAGRDRAVGQTYWIADPRPYPMHEILDTIEAVLSEDFGLAVARRRVPLPGVAADVAYLADAGLQRAGLYSQKLHVLGELGRTIACSVDKARTELDWIPGPGLREGMRRSVEWCLKNDEPI